MITPAEIRNQNFDSLREAMHAQLRAAYHTWLAYGPGTTRDVALRGGMSLLTFRPRTTDLYQCGLVECVGKKNRHGIYRVRTVAEWEAWKIEQLAAVT